MPNIIDSYLIQLGAVVDKHSMRDFEMAIEQAAKLVDTEMLAIAASAAGAQVAVVAAFAAIGVAAIELANHVAQADQQYRLFALHMYMSKNAARALKVAMDELGVSLEDMTWDTELRKRASELIDIERRAAPGGDFDAQLQKMRDIRFEFNRMEVELQYLTMNVVGKFMDALGIGPDTILRKLREFNEWVIKNMPMISDKITTYLLPVWNDVVKIFQAFGRELEAIGVLFTNVMGLFTNDKSIQGATFDWKKFATAVEYLINFLTKLIDIATEVITTITDINTAIFTFLGYIAKLASIGGVKIDAAVTSVASTASDATKSVVASSPSLNLMAHAVAMVESGNRQFDKFGNVLLGKATRYGQAIGKMQLLPSTARAMGVDPYSEAGNEEGGSKYLDWLMKRYHGNMAEAFGAYNTGPGNMDKFLAGKASLARETQNYISKAMGEAGQRGDVTVGSITIHITEPGANVHQIHKAVTAGVDDGVNKRTQRTLQEFQGSSWSYGG